MHSTTKRRLLPVAFMLLSLGWPQLGWSTAYPPTAAQTGAQGLREVTDKLQEVFESAYTSSYGAFVRENIAAIGGVYALVALLLLLNPDYRNEGWNNFGRGCLAFCVLVGWFVVGHWIAMSSKEIFDAHGGHHVSPVLHGGDWLITLATGLIHPLLMIALILTLWIGVPLYLLFVLFILPSVLFVLLRLLVRLPFLIYHQLHYLTVPHPAETAYRAGMAANLPLAELASTVADAMCESDFKGYAALPKAWKSKNWTKRIDAFHARLEAQDRFMGAYSNVTKRKPHG
jgi:hypothetical protein